jgi:hypothetical protein
MTFKFSKMVLTTARRYTMCISLGVLIVSDTASATLIDSIAALEEGAMYRVLFVTSEIRDAASPLIEDYNDFVSTGAASGSITSSLGLTWKALASTLSVNAQDNSGVKDDDETKVTMFNTLGEIVATSGANFWGGSLYSPIRFNQDGRVNNNFNGHVWTGTNNRASQVTAGVLGVLVSGPLTVNNGFATYGRFNETDFRWSSDNSSNTSDLNAVYGVSSAVMKPQANVPLPGMVLLLSLGLASLSFARYRK